MSTTHRASRGRRTAAALTVGLASIAVVGSPAPAMGSPAREPEVVVVNTSADPVQATLVDNPGVTIANTPSVNIGTMPAVRVDTSQGPVPVSLQNAPSLSGTVGIDPAQNTVQVGNLSLPFQAILVAESESGPGRMCAQLPAPGAGRLLRVSSVGFRAKAVDSTAAGQLHAYLRPVNMTAAESLDIPIDLEVSPQSAAFRIGALTGYEFLHGEVQAPAAETFIYLICAEHKGQVANSIREITAHVTGTIVSAG